MDERELRSAQGRIHTFVKETPLQPGSGRGQVNEVSAPPAKCYLRNERRTQIAGCIFEG